MKDLERFLKSLPKVDENYEIQAESLKAFNAFLPADAYCFREESVADFGVDGSLELFEQGQATNFRAQVQMKGTRSLEPNQDGSYSLNDVATTNLQYLLNGQIPIYILHIQPIGEFRYVWARDEFKRLAKENPKWLDQKTVTIRFREILNDVTLNQIKEQIIRESSFRRQMSEMLRIADSPSVRVEIDPDDLSITDPDEVYRSLSNGGINLINEGYALTVIEKINWLEGKHRNDPKIRLVHAYGEYMRTRYRTAIEILDLLDVEGHTLPAGDLVIARWIRASSQYQTGVIDSETYTQNLGEIANDENTSEFSNYRFEYIRRQLLSEENLDSRSVLGIQLQAEFDKLPARDAHSEAGLGFRFIIFQSQLALLVGELSKDMQRITLRKRLYKDANTTVPDIANVLAKTRQRLDTWFTGMDEIANETQNPILKADVAVEKVMLVNHQAGLTSFHSNINGVKLPPIDAEFVRQCKISLLAAIDIYTAFGVHERRLRAQVCLADLLSFSGDGDASDQLFAEVSAASNKMSYSNVEMNSTHPLSKLQERIDERNAGFEADEAWASKTEEELAQFAQQMLDNVGLPQNRIANLLTDVKANQDVCRERLNWCDQIQLIQDLTHTRNPETCYARPLKFWAVCSRFGYETIIPNGDSGAVIDAFKKAYCNFCTNRSPKKG